MRRKSQIGNCISDMSLFFQSRLNRNKQWFANPRVAILDPLKAGAKPMKVPSFDIFSGLPNSKEAVWLETVVGLGDACTRMKELAASAPGPYFVFHAYARTILASIDTTPNTESKENSQVA